MIINNKIYTVCSKERRIGCGGTMIKILIVDDEGIERRGIKFLLKNIETEFDICEASNGMDALECLKTQNIDILFTDIKMPFMNGMDLIKKVKENDIKCKIVIFSGYEEFEYAKFATEMGVINYILKPVDPEEFKSTLIRIIDEIKAEKLAEEKSNKNISFLKEHLLYSLVYGSSIKELEEKSKGLLDISFINDYRRIVLLEFEQDFFGVKEYDIKKIIKSKVNMEFQYLNLNSRESLLFLTNSNLKNEEVRQLGIAIHEAIKTNCMCQCFIGIGNEINNAEEISSSYERVELLVEKYFFNKNEFVFIEDNLCENKVISKDHTDNIIKAIKQDINIKDSDALKKNFKCLCNIYENEEDFSNMYVKFIFSNILKDLYENISEISEDKFKEDINKLYKSTDFAKVLKIINGYVEKFVESVSKNPMHIHKEIETIKKYIYENYDKDIGVEVLATQVCFAPSYLSYIFKKETGQNLSKFIKSYRMIKAKEMLENTYEKIVNVSYAVGYRNVSYFCQSFREYFGVSPQKFRNEGETLGENK